MKRLVAIAVAVAGCGPAAPSATTTIAMDFARPGFWDAPFPSDDLRRSDGTVDLSRFPNPDKVQMIDEAETLLAGAHGFAQAGAIYFRASAALDPASLPGPADSTGDGASVFVEGIDPTKPGYQVRQPLDVAFLADGGPFGAPNLLALLPIQGLPLPAGQTFVAVVTTKVRDAAGLGLRSGIDPNATPDLAKGFAAISSTISAAEIAGMTVFTTDTPTAAMELVRSDLLSRAPPPIAAPTLSATYTDYCSYATTIAMPVYQAGTPPYAHQGGGWKFGPDGKPLVDHTETAGILFTIPRAPTPPAGWPLVVFIRAGGGGTDPLLNRGPSPTANDSPGAPPGTGPAMDLSRAGFAAVQIDGPFEGPRNSFGQDEDSLIFNVLNPEALRDNLRQSAVELSLMAKLLPPMQFSVADCPGADAARFDASHLALMGHSMGGWIAPLSLAVEPKYGAAVLSGAGGSYIANIMDKIKPTQIRPLAEIILDYNTEGFTLERHDPALTIIQWAAEPSDPQVYDARIIRAPAMGESPRQVLMIQGIVDHYILPSIANSTSLALGLDEAGPIYDATSPEEMMLDQTPLGTVIALGGRKSIALPATGNIDPQTTAVVVQHPGDNIKDGHEVMFQTPAPKHQYRCFLSSWLKGTPKVPADGAEEDPCP
jgi:hypothetical protein